jgi:L-lactate utilization protein LutC
MSDREAILRRLQQLQSDVPHPGANRPRPTLGSDLLAELRQRMTAMTIDVVQLPAVTAVPQWVANYLERHHLPARVLAGVNPALDGLPWQQAALQCEQRAATGEDPVAISTALCAIAESGTAVLQSGPDNPASLNFLPDHHIIVLQRQTIFAYWEQAWEFCRRQWRDRPPRAINVISGPSSTADVGLTQVFGAHGPRNLSVLIIGG